ncbi:hypothetical protein J3R73_004975 [Labrys monachus]|uniref:Uncharacterized protein n=1 Tax=Labrys monachus TaxID=217067 RepID=A0ABU0FKP6_9HYPH|nr:hypothetical protein [Labrys monachus]
MQYSQIPVKFQIPFAGNAGGVYINAIPQASQPGGRGTANAGMAPGSGAGGAQTVASTSLAGAAGADGMVLVLEFP